MFRDWRKGLLFVGIVIFITFLTVLAYLGSYSRFIADDYCSAAKANSMGVLGGTLYWYSNWSGRFSASFLDSLMGFIGPSITPYASTVVILIWLVVLIGVLYFLVSGPHKRTRFLCAVLLAEILLSATLTVIPTLSQSLHWGQGMRSVVPPLILATAFIGLIQYRRKQVPKKPYVWLVVAGGLTFVAGGFNETYVASQTFMLAIVTLLGVMLDVSDFKRNLLPVVVVGLFCSISSMVVVIAAPGNSYRQALFPPPPGMLKLIEITGSSLVQFVEGMMFSPRKMLSLLGVIGFFTLLGSGKILDKTPDMISRKAIIQVLLWLPVLTLVQLFVCFAPAAYGMSSSPPLRTYIIPTYILVCALALWGYVLGQLNQTDRSFAGLSTRSFQLLVAWSVSILFILNTLWVTYRALQVQPKLNSYAMTWDRVDQLIRQAKIAGYNSIDVMPVRNFAGLDDFGDDPHYWVNECVSAYYGLSVKTDDSLKK